MTVYVDDMNAPYGRMKMCHMLADTDEELHAMADRIGVARKWWQSPEKTSGSHYDIALSKKALAIAAGAVAITWRQAGAMNARRRITGELGNPWTASAWVAAHFVARRAQLAEQSAQAAALFDNPIGKP
jgi:alkanesulfonate monooxygenase SsuD/methylene tetrahydromethanopterin reductase-like flavin-dependent oxidoreductase (luciferase family)